MHPNTTKDPDFQSLHQFFLNAAHQIHHPDRPYLFKKIGNDWVPFTYKQILENVDKICGFLKSLGIAKGDRVAMVMDNCPEYYCIDQALQKLGIVNVSIYPTLTPPETAFVLNDSGSRLLFVGTHFLLKKFKKIKSECPSVLKVVTMFDDKDEEDAMELTFDEMLAAGAQAFPQYKEEIERDFKSVGHHDISTFIYTSGTTGVPKGAMLSHYNFMSNCYDGKDLCPAINSQDLLLSFLPLSHVYERMATYYLSTYIGAQVAFAESIEKVAQNINEIQPTIMACVPRLLERVHDKVIKNATDAGGIKAKIFLWALSLGETWRKLQDDGKKPSLMLKWKHALAEKLVYSKIKAKMGGRMRLFVSGGGALPQHVGEFFANLGLKVQEGYGLTETSPFISVNEFDRQVYGTVGRIAPRQMVAIQDIESGKIITTQTYDSFDPQFVSAEGEILAKGPNIMKGYWNNPSETAKVFDENGWFHTGDIGRFEKGYLKITDRLKNMLVTSLGKNIYPTQVENHFLMSPKIDQFFIVADKREYVTALVVPNREEAIKQLGIPENYFENGEVMIEDPKLRDWLEEDIKKLSQKLANYERVREFMVKREPFSVESEEMTISLKVKRNVVMKNYADWIERMYHTHGPNHS